MVFVLLHCRMLVWRRSVTSTEVSLCCDSGNGSLSTLSVLDKLEKGTMGPSGIEWWVTVITIPTKWFLKYRNSVQFGTWKTDIEVYFNSVCPFHRKQQTVLEKSYKQIFLLLLVWFLLLFVFWWCRQQVTPGSQLLWTNSLPVSPIPSRWEVLFKKVTLELHS